MPRTVVTVAQNGSTMRRRPNPPKAVTAQARKMRGGGNPRTTAPENNRPRAVSPERLGGSKQEHFAVMICGDVTEFIHTACETFAPEDQQAEDNDSIIDKEAKDAPTTGNSETYAQYSKPVEIEDDNEGGFETDKEVNPLNSLPFLRDISYQSVLTEAQSHLLEAQSQLTTHLDTAAKEIQRAFPLENVSLAQRSSSHGPILVDDDGYFEEVDDYSKAEARPGSLKDITNNYQSVVKNATNQLSSRISSMKRVLSLQTQTRNSLPTNEDFDKYFCMQWSVKRNVLPGLDRWKGVMRSNKNGSPKEGPPLGLVQGYWIRRHHSYNAKSDEANDSESSLQPLCASKNALELVDLDKLDPGLGHFLKCSVSHGWPDEASINTNSTTFAPTNETNLDQDDLSQMFSESGGNYDNEKEGERKNNDESYECCLVSHVWIAPQFRGDGWGLVLAEKASSVVPYRYRKECPESKVSIVLSIPPFAKKLNEHFAKSGIWKQGWHNDFLLR